MEDAMRQSLFATTGLALACGVMVFCGWFGAGLASAFGVTEGKDARLSDEALEVKVEEALRLDERIDWRLLKVIVADRTATLVGEVRTPEERGLVSQVVTSVPGIHAVENYILVEPSLPDRQGAAQAHLEEQPRDRVLGSPEPLKDKQVMP
jgi:hypothetical protein